jgi:hypothetical protein
MNGKRNNRLSWEKQTYFDLDNGVRVCVEYGFYGEFIKSAEDKEGVWYANKGQDTLPERFKFLLEWNEVVVKSCNDKLIRPKFEKIF